jgi:hypothetical protein
LSRVRRSSAGQLGEGNVGEGSGWTRRCANDLGLVSASAEGADEGVEVLALFTGEVAVNPGDRHQAT